MTVEELIEQLEQLDPDQQVRIILEQRYSSLEYQVGPVLDVGSFPVYEDEPDGRQTDSAVYLITGDQVGYVSEAANNYLMARGAF